nr:LysR family transcriptional regulator [Sphingomonas sp. Y57]
MVNLRLFDLNLLRVFETVYADRSVSKAAETLGLSQPAVSNALSRLRHQLGDPLFIRTTHGMEATPKAEVLARSINEGLTTIRAGLSAVGDFDPATSDRQFTLLMTDGGEICFLPRLLKELNDHAPNIDIRVIEASLATYETLLESGAADLAIGRFKLSDSLLGELIHTSGFMAVMCHDNPFLTYDNQGVPTIDYMSYLNAPHVVVQPRGAAGDPVGDALGKDARNRRIALTVPHAMVLPIIMGGTQLIATVPKACVPSLTMSRGLCAVPVPFAVELNYVYQWWHRRTDRDPGHRWLRDFFSNCEDAAFAPHP